MIAVALKSLWGRKTRSALTAISIVLGTCMITGTFVVRDQISGAFSEIFQTGLEKTDVLASKKTAFTSDQGAQAGPLPASLIDTIKHVNGVAEAEGQIQALGALVVNGKYAGSNTGAPSLVVSSLSDTFNPYSFSAGHAPQASGEVVVNSQLADDKHLKIGQHVQFATEVGLKPVTIVGIFKLGTASTIGGATIVGTTFDDAQQWFDRSDETSTISIKADPGVSQEELKRRIVAAVPSYVKVQTGPEAAKDQAQQTSSGITDFLTPLLLAFAGATVFAGAFIIFNTFAITVAQRAREFALLRTLGASRRQVLRSVLLEASVIGVLASLTGIAAGVGFAKLLDVAFDAVGFGLPTAPIKLGLITVALPLAVGTIVALLAALGPALRATRVPPIAALREGAEMPPSWASTHATMLSSLLGVAGLALIVDGVFRKGAFVQAVIGLGKTPSLLISMAAGAILCFLAVSMLATHVVPSLAQAIGQPLGLAIRGTDWLGGQLVSVPVDRAPLTRKRFIVRRALAYAAALAWLVLELVLKFVFDVPGSALVGIVIAVAGIAWIQVGRSPWPLARGWYVLRRVFAYLLAALLFVALGAIVSFIVALIFRPLVEVKVTFFAALLLVVVPLSLFAVYRIWRGTETEWPPEEPSPLTSRLARENTTRNPSRTAVTSSSLMIGVALVVFVAVFVNGFKDSFLGALDSSISSDLIIQSESFSPIPKQAVPTVQGLPQVAYASGIQFTDARINTGGTDVVNGIDPISTPHLYHFDWQKGGSDELLQNFNGDEALIEEQFAKSHHLSIGDHFQITSIEGDKKTLKVVGQYRTRC